MKLRQQIAALGFDSQGMYELVKGVSVKCMNVNMFLQHHLLYPGRLVGSVL